ncbi:MAG: GIY-YIG nuclease family protein [Ignavibacteria bacterium]|nr:MAG: GIY-YIG nuclease family protein [Ignavibacteria bacterium]
MNYSVYILKSGKDKKRYVGCTKNILRRLAEHNNGLAKSTRNRRPLELIYTEGFENKSDAIARERFFKSGKGREYLDKNNIK